MERGPNSLLASPSTITEEQIDEMIGVLYETIKESTF